MDWLNLSDTHFLLSCSVSLFIFCAFYIFAIKKQDRALKRVDTSIKLQELTNQNLATVIAELRRSNQILAELAGMDVYDQTHYHPSQQGIPYSNGMHAHAGQMGQDGVDSANKLYVGNVDYAASESELASFFASYGQVDHVNIPINRYTGRARGFGFVTFASKSDAERAMVLNGSEFRGRQIQVNFAKEREAAQ